jgi:hypothetical protein
MNETTKQLVDETKSKLESHIISMPPQQFVYPRLFHPHMTRSKCRGFSVTFTTSSLSTPAAYGCLELLLQADSEGPPFIFDTASCSSEHVLDTTPHRSVRARLRLRLLPRMNGVEALVGIRMQNARLRNPPG